MSAATSPCALQTSATVAREPVVFRLFSRFGWSAIGAVWGFLLLLAILYAALPPEHALHVPDYLIVLIGKIMCYAMVALALDLVWGYAGILSLGHGLFFALGGYVFGMYLMRQIGHDSVYKSDLPDFMVFLDWKEYPWFWAGTDQFWYVLLLVILLPGLLAMVFGFFAFRSRIKGVYFSIITQALTYAAMLLFFRNNTGFGGNNGFTDFKRILDIGITQPGMKVTLFLLTATALLGALLLCRWIVSSKLGRVMVAIRDAESRLRFCGYDTVGFKVFLWTVSAAIAGIAGALYVPQVGIINPGEMSPANSIEIAIAVAVGGRGTLVGALVGAGVLHGLKSWVTVAFPEVWLYVLGLLFVLVTLFLPQGIVGIWSRLKNK